MRNLPFYFALRYLFSKKSVNAINIISGISIIGIMFSTAALIIILSFFNGMERLILSMYSSFTADLRIEPIEGKTFSTDSINQHILSKHEQVISYTDVLQEKVLLRNKEQQFIGTLKGISPEYTHVKSMDSLLYDGSFSLQEDGEMYAIIGGYIQHALGVSLYDESAYVEVFSARKGQLNVANPAEEFNVRKIKPRGVMVYQQDFDDILFVPLDFAKELLGEYDEASAIELNISPGASVANIQNDLQTKVGNEYIIKNREQQNPSLYKTIRSEKWAVFFILTLTGIIAIFNIIGSLTMLVIDKKNDISILRSIGADNTLIQRIFFYEGILISFLGCISGLVIGLLFCFSQQHFGWLKLSQAEGLIVDTYPVDIRSTDVILVSCTISIVAILIAYLSSRLSVKGT